MTSILTNLAKVLVVTLITEAAKEAIKKVNE